MNQQLRRLTEFLESEEGRAWNRSMGEFAKKLAKKQEIERNQTERLKGKFQGGHDRLRFDILMEKAIERSENTESPTNVLRSLIRLAETEGKEIQPIDNLTRNFPSAVFEYLGWQFAITFGQGTCYSVYKDRELRYRS